jgi:membrane protein DedA with SNARE-associated domain
MVLTFLSLAFGTLVSEDLACVTAGLLIQRGQIDPSTGIIACIIGIFGGDVGLWGAGRVFGHAALAWPWIARKRQSFGDLRAWLERHAAGAIVGSRFLPGTRLPLYVMAGFVRLPVAIFAAWAFIGALLWTPVLVLLTAKLGDAFITRLSAPTSIGWLGSLLTAAVILGILHLWRGHLGPRSRG